MGNPNNNDPRDNQHLRPEKREKRTKNYQHGNTEDPAKTPGRNVKVPNSPPGKAGR